MTYEIRIIETVTGKIEKTMEAPNFRRACKIELGASINLNHEEYHTDIYKDNEVVYEDESN